MIIWFGWLDPWFTSPCVSCGSNMQGNVRADPTLVSYHLDWYGSPIHSFSIGFELEKRRSGLCLWYVNINGWKSLMELWSNLERLTSTGFNCSLSLPIFPGAAFIVEKLAQRKYISEPVSCINPAFLIGFLFVDKSIWYKRRWRPNQDLIDSFIVHSSVLWKHRIQYACLGIPFEFIHFALINTA